MIPEVEKIGSQWNARIVAIDDEGALVTNVMMEEIIPLAANSKVWIEYGKEPATIRGLSAQNVEPGRAFAREGATGLLEIAVQGGSAQQKSGAQVGDRVTIHFRT